MEQGKEQGKEKRTNKCNLKISMYAHFKKKVAV